MGWQSERAAICQAWRTKAETMEGVDGMRPRVSFDLMTEIYAVEKHTCPRYFLRWVGWLDPQFSPVNLSRFAQEVYYLALGCMDTKKKDYGRRSAYVEDLYRTDAV